MNKLPASTGWLWIKQGFALFRKQPLAMTALLFSCVFLSIAFLLIPLLGAILPVLTMPILSVALLEACSAIDQGKPVRPGLVFIGFKKHTRLPLIALGSLYLLVTILAFGVMYAMDDGQFLKMALREIPFDPTQLEDSKYAVLVATMIMQLAWLFSCFAAPLIYWKKMSLGKALFFSFFSVLRSFKAFATSVIIFFVISQLASVIAGLLLGPTQVAILVLPILAFIVMVIHCWQYVSYRQLFGAPQDTETEVGTPQ